MGRTRTKPLTKPTTPREWEEHGAEWLETTVAVYTRCAKNLVEKIVSGEILASENGSVRLALDWLAMRAALDELKKGKG